MTRLFSSRERSFDMGVLPTELLARDAPASMLRACGSEVKEVWNVRAP